MRTGRYAERPLMVRVVPEVHAETQRLADLRGEPAPDVLRRALALGLSQIAGEDRTTATTEARTGTPPARN